MIERNESPKQNSKFPLGQDVIEYFDDVSIKLRDGDYSSPEGKEIFLEYAQSIREKIEKEANNSEIITDFENIVEIIYILMEFEEAEWTHEIASEIRKIIVK